MNQPTLINRILPQESSEQVAKLLPYVAVFVRFSVGLSLLNSALVSTFARNGPGGQAFPMGMMGGPGVPLGTDGLMMILPYAELAVSVGLIFGIFTTISALAACFLSLLSPTMTTLALLTNGPQNLQMNFFGFQTMNLLFPNLNTLTYVATVILSPISLNRFSIDAMIFQRPPRSPVQRDINPNDQVEVEPMR